MIKYIIKNCPKLANTNRRIGEIFDTCGGIDYDTDEFEYCKDVDNCLLKNIVKICDSSVSKVLYEGESLKLIEGNKLASDILKLLDIEEVNE